MLQFAWLNMYEYLNNYYNITITEKKIFADLCDEGIECTLWVTQ